LAPYVLGGVLIWFIIAYFANTSIINSATGSEPLSRMENKRVYNLVENLCMSQGMKMPKINIINDDSLNAFASGINERTYTVSLSRGIIDKLDDQELEAVIAHELSHIRNKDVRLMIVSIVFVGIFAMLAQMAMRSVYYSSMSRRRDEKNNTAIIIVLVMVVAAIGYFFSMLMTKLFSSSIWTLKSSLVIPGAANSTLYSFSVSNTLMAGAVALAFTIQSLSKKSLKILGNQF